MNYLVWVQKILMLIFFKNSGIMIVVLCNTLVIFHMLIFYLVYQRYFL